MPEALNTLIANMMLNLRLQDALDIAIVAFIFYRMILMLRNTRAMMLVQGIVVIIMLSLISIIFQFRAISWLLNKLITASVVAIPIIFQDELRRVLEELGRGIAFASGMAVGRDTQQHTEALGEIVRAVDYLAMQRIGALIVLERQTGLQEFADTGILLESIISYQLLANIFIPNTPLHDGALIIRGDRIVSAACYLPLSTNNDISQELGTRHRAAIGLTEKSDALVIVVSEETGTISLAQEGKLTRYLDGAMLNELLRNRFDRSKKRNPWQQWLTGGEKTDD